MMSASSVSICSNAIVMVGGKPINSFDGGEDRAVAAQNLYPTIRDALLRRHPWNCTIKRLTLSPALTPPEFDYDFAFSLPGDWLRTLSVGKSGELPDYKVEGRTILADCNPFYLRYQRRAPESDWDAQLVHLATLAMAAVLAYPISRSNAVLEQMRTDFRLALAAAMAVDGQEEPAQTLGDFPLIMAGYTNGPNAFD